MSDSPFPKDSVFKQNEMKLAAWNLDKEPYDHEALAKNFEKVDAHDMSRGVQKVAGGKTLTVQQVKRLRDILNECDDREERCFDIVQEGLDILR